VPSDGIAEALAATRESRRVAFKRHGAPSDGGAWLEVLKDVVALANSGGGVVVVGVDSHGQPNGRSGSFDARAVIEAVAQYTGDHFTDIDVLETKKDSRPVAAITVGARSGSPLVFERAGQFVDERGRHRVSFARGTLYFRHGSRTEPARGRDVAKFATGELGREKRDIARNVSKVAQAPVGSEVIIVPPDTSLPGSLERFRVVDDPRAPAVARTDFDVTHPFRQKELIERINERLGEKIVGPYEILSIRRVHATDDRPEFFHRPKFGSPQYSDTFVTWIVDQVRHDPEFLPNAKREYQATLPKRGRRHDDES
jgi:hypothetical protein